MSLENAHEIINFIKESKKKTPVQVYVNGDFKNLYIEGFKAFGTNEFKILIGDWEVISIFLEKNKERFSDIHIDNECRNSAIPLIDQLNINARIEPGALIREHAIIKDRAIIMMGAVINIGAVVGEGTMIDMNAVLGGRATVGKNCHIGAGAVLAGVIEPPSANPVIIEDDVMIGANAVVLEGVRVGKNSVVAAGAIVVNDVAPNSVVAGVPARVIKMKDEKTMSKTELMDALRTL